MESIRATASVAAWSIEASSGRSAGTVVTLVLVDAMVVVMMQVVALGASAFEAADQVLASFGALGVIQAFVGIHAVCSSRVELKTTRTDALEAAQDVHAFSGSRTDALLQTFVDIDAIVAVLCVSAMTGTSVASLRVDAIVLT